MKDGEYIWGLVDYASENYKSMRDVLSEAAETAKQAKDVADGAAQAIAAVQNTISVIPSQSGSLTYNGGTQLPSWNNLALEMMDITYGEFLVGVKEEEYCPASVCAVSAFVSCSGLWFSQVGAWASPV